MTLNDRYALPYSFLPGSL